MSFTYLVVDSFSIVFLLILYTSIREQEKGFGPVRCFCLIVMLTIGVLFSDMMAWLFDGRAGAVERVLLWLFNVLCYLFSGGIALGWFYYVDLKLEGPQKISKLGWVLIALPCCFQIAASLLSPWTHWMFYLDATNTYQRGPLFAIQSIIPLGYIIAASVQAWMQAMQERLPQRRRECLYLCSFIIFPFIGAVLQVAVYGLSLAWPCTALSLMMVQVNLQNQRISLDALTGMNNRGQLDRYLYNRMSRGERETPFALMMLDIDEFKKINDRLGHTAGDAALVDAAGILKKAFEDGGAFLSRYGGDEFAVVMDCTGELQVQRAVARIDAAAQRFNERTDARPYKLVFSIGYVRSDSRRYTQYQDMIADADAQMYLQKEQHKAVRK